MARAPQRSSGGPGFGGMIIFLVLSALLALACIFFFLTASKRGASLTKLQGEIRSDLEDPLSKGLGVRAQPVAGASDVAYDDAFFTKIKSAALDGMNYAAMSNITGYANADEVKSELQKAPAPEPEHLRAYVTKLIGDLGDAQRQLSERNQALQLANAQTKSPRNFRHRRVRT